MAKHYANKFKSKHYENKLKISVFCYNCYVLCTCVIQDITLMLCINNLQRRFVSVFTLLCRSPGRYLKDISRATAEPSVRPRSYRLADKAPTDGSTKYKCHCILPKRTHTTCAIYTNLIWVG